jgi:hypothetical protein
VRACAATHSRDQALSQPAPVGNKPWASQHRWAARRRRRAAGRRRPPAARTRRPARAARRPAPPCCAPAARGWSRPPPAAPPAPPRRPRRRWPPPARAERLGLLRGPTLTPDPDPLGAGRLLRAPSGSAACHGPPAAGACASARSARRPAPAPRAGSSQRPRPPPAARPAAPLVVAGHRPTDTHPSHPSRHQLFSFKLGLRAVSQCAPEPPC